MILKLIIRDVCTLIYHPLSYPLRSLCETKFGWGHKIVLRRKLKRRYYKIKAAKEPLFKIKTPHLFAIIVKKAPTT